METAPISIVKRENLSIPITIAALHGMGELPESPMRA